MIHKAAPVLLLIDVQQGFQDPVWGQRNNPMAEQNIAALLAHWRQCNMPVIHVQHLSIDPRSPLRPSQPGVDFCPLVRPKDGETIIQKHVNSAFIGTELESTLRKHNWEELIIVGLTTDHCVSTTTRMAANLGFRATVIADATATYNRRGPSGEEFRAELVHEVALASLSQEFASIQFTDSLIASLSPASPE